jgi:hypothetical protein
VPLSRLPISQSLSRQIRPRCNSKCFSNLAYRVADGRHPVAAIIKQIERLHPTLATGDPDKGNVRLGLIQLDLPAMFN